MMGTTKITAGVIALIAICIISFVGVRQLAKGEQINNPTIQANQNITIQQNAPETMPPTSETAPATEPTVSETQTTAESTPSSENVLTTYDIPTSMMQMPTTMVTTTTPPVQTTAQPTIIMPSPTTSKQNTSVTTKPATTDPYIQQAAKEDGGFLDYKYNETGNYYYTNSDPWQRSFGFNAAYDFGAQFVFMFYDSARIKFSYGDKDWMVETWKGQYGAVFLGAEIGVYYKPKDRTVEHYDCVSDTDALYMEMTLFRNGEELFSREYTRYWWCTGFVPGKLKKYSDRSELTLKARITLPNQRMLKAFVGGLERCEEFKFVEGTNYRIDGRDVFIIW